MDKTERRFKAVFAGLHNVLRTTRLSNNPLAHYGNPICVGPLVTNGEWTHAQALIQEPLGALGYDFEDGKLVVRILSQTNYYPSLIQIYGNKLVKHLNNQNMLNDICAIEINDEVIFSLRRIEEIRESADYHGFRVALEAVYPPIKVPLKVDITTGDIITPKEINYEFRLLFDSRSIRIIAYNLETIRAEKLETTRARGNQNTRPRDYYDIYIIRKLQWQNIDPRTLKEALLNTCQSRGTINIIKRYDEILKAVQTSDAMSEFWKDYQNQFDYARDIGFDHICHTIREILNDILE